MVVGGASAVLFSREVLFVAGAVLGWGSQRKLKSDWRGLLTCRVVSGAGTLGGRAANLLPVAEYVVCVNSLGNRSLIVFGETLTICNLRLRFRIHGNLVEMAASFYRT